MSDLVPVMSLWTAPQFGTSYPTKIDLKFFLYYWALSARLARKQYGKVQLYVDDLGRELLVDVAGIKFTDVFLELNRVPVNPRCWAGGKFYTYSMQDKPYLHLDFDVLLWKRLPERMMSAEVVLQNKEYFVDGWRYYYPVTEFIKNVPWYPSYYSKYDYLNHSDYAYNVGIIGGTNFRALREYSEDAIAILNNPVNKDAFTDSAFLKLKTGEARYIVLLLEQYGLSCYLRHHNIPVETMFSDFFDFLNKSRKEELGYEHLLSWIKGRDYVRARIEAFMQKNMFRTYRRISSLKESTLEEFVKSKSIAESEKLAHSCVSVCSANT